jgi:protein transport protein SEC31
VQADKVAVGDRTHIPQSSKPIYDILSSELARVKQAPHPVSSVFFFFSTQDSKMELMCQAPIQKIVDDTERRLNILFDGLNNDSVPKVAIDKLHEITRGTSFFLQE